MNISDKILSQSMIVRCPHPQSEVFTSLMYDINKKYSMTCDGEGEGPLLNKCQSLLLRYIFLKWQKIPRSLSK